MTRSDQYAAYGEINNARDLIAVLREDRRWYDGLTPRQKQRLKKKDTLLWHEVGRVVVWTFIVASAYVGHGRSARRVSVPFVMSMLKRGTLKKGAAFFSRTMLHHRSVR